MTNLEIPLLMQYSFKKAACCSARYPAWRSTPSRTPRTPSASSCSSTWSPASERLPAQFVCLFCHVYSCVRLRTGLLALAACRGPPPSFLLLPLPFSLSAALRRPQRAWK